MTVGGQYGCRTRADFRSQQSLVYNRGSTHISFYACFVHHFINVIRRNPRFDLRRREIENFPPQLAHLAHSFLLLLVEDGDLISADKHLLGSRYPVFGVVGMRYSVGYRSTG